MSFYASYPVVGGGVTIYPTFSAFPPTAAVGTFAVAADSGILYEFFGGSWQAVAAPGDVLSLGSPSNGLSLAANVLTLAAASTSTTGALTSTDWNTFNGKQNALTIGNLTDAGTDGITITGGTGSIIGSGVAISQHVSDASHNGYLSSTDWSTFNGKQAALTIGNITDAGTDGITITGGTGAIIGSGVSLSQHVADSTHNGYLSSADWTTFNGKGSGTVTSVSVASSNGFAGTSSGGATPSLTLSTTVSGILSGNGTAISAAGNGSIATTLIAGTASQVMYIDPTTYMGGDSAFTFNDTTKTLSVTNISGALTGNVTGTASGNTTYTANQYGVVLSGSGNTMSVLAPDASTTKVLTSGGTGANPTWSAVPASSTVSTTTQSGNTNYYPTFVAANSTSTQSLDVGPMTYNPSTGALTYTAFISSTSTPATTGSARFANNTDKISWRNAANSADQSFYLNSSDIFTVTKGFSPSSDLALNLGDATHRWANVDSNNYLLSNSSGTVTLSPNASSGTYTWTLPAAQGGSGTLLSNSDGAGGLSWVTPTSAATASAIVQRNAQINTFANQFVQKFATTATAAGTTILTAASAPYQEFTGTSTQTVQLPDATTLTTGFIYTVINKSTGVVTVKDNGSNTLQAIPGGGNCKFTCASIGTSNGVWDTSESWQSGFIAPTVQKFTSSSGTYTTPTSPRGPLYLRIRMVGGGGGGEGSGGSGGNGGDTTWSVHSGAMIVTAGKGGGGGTPGTSFGGAGGTISTSAGPIYLCASAGTAGGASTSIALGTASAVGGSGAGTPLGGGGGGGASGGNVGSIGVGNTGAGGGGGGGGTTGYGGGGSGAYAEFIITSPSASYDYSVGAGGTAGATNGAGGGSGVIIVEEFYQ